MPLDTGAQTQQSLYTDIGPETAVRPAFTWCVLKQQAGAYGPPVRSAQCRQGVLPQVLLAVWCPAWCVSLPVQPAIMGSRGQAAAATCVTAGATIAPRSDGRYRKLPGLSSIPTAVTECTAAVWVAEGVWGYAGGAAPHAHSLLPNHMHLLLPTQLCAPKCHMSSACVLPPPDITCQCVAGCYHATAADCRGALCHQPSEHCHPVPRPPADGWRQVPLHVHAVPGHPCTLAGALPGGSWGVFDLLFDYVQGTCHHVEAHASTHASFQLSRALRQPLKLPPACRTRLPSNPATQQQCASHNPSRPS
jgi:hypothetical protein